MTATQEVDLVARYPISTGGSGGGAKFAVTPLHAGDMDAVTPMTFPAFRADLAGCLSEQARDGCKSIALVARDDGIPVGLALAQLPVTAKAQEDGAERPKTARLLSISVVPAWRRRGAARRLMMSVEDELRQRGCARVSAGYTTRMPAYKAFERLLAACRWSAPEATMLMPIAAINEWIKAPWLAAPLATPPGFELFEWAQLAAGERSQLQQDLAAGAIPAGLSPFADEETIEPAISIGVRHRGEVVAWMIVIRSPWVPDALCYRSLFVRPRLRAAQGLGPLSLAAAIRRHVASPVCEERPLAVFGMSLKMSTKMINFFRKRLAPFCLSTEESRAALKTLA